MTPGSSSASAIQRPSSSRSNSTVSFTASLYLASKGADRTVRAELGSVARLSFLIRRPAPETTLVRVVREVSSPHFPERDFPGVLVRGDLSVRMSKSRGPTAARRFYECRTSDQDVVSYFPGCLLGPDSKVGRRDPKARPCGPTEQPGALLRAPHPSNNEAKVHVLWDDCRGPT